MQARDGREAPRRNRPSLDRPQNNELVACAADSAALRFEPAGSSMSSDAEVAAEATVEVSHSDFELARRGAPTGSRPDALLRLAIDKQERPDSAALPVTRSHT